MFVQVFLAGLFKFSIIVVLFKGSILTRHHLFKKGTTARKFHKEGQLFFFLKRMLSIKLCFSVLGNPDTSMFLVFKHHISETESYPKLIFPQVELSVINCFLKNC